MSFAAHMRSYTDHYITR